MSEHTSSSTVVQATPSNRDLVAALLADRLGVPSEWFPSNELRAVRSELTAATRDIGRASALLDKPAMRLPTLDRQALGAVRASISSGVVPSVSAWRPLLDGLGVAERATVTAERQAVAVLTVRALTDLGFAVRSMEGLSTSAIEARRGHAVMVARVDDGGALVTDWLGHGGDECERDMRELLEALESHGVRISVRHRTRHGSPEGGSLLERAAACSRDDLALGVVLDAEGASGPVRAESGRTSDRAPQRLRGGA